MARLTTPSDQPYQSYARFYDASGQLRFSVLMEQYLRELLRNYPLAGRAMIDLGCGTGTLALLMAEQGWRVLGIDQSVAMLDEARQKAARIAEPISVRFEAGDIREWSVEQQVDVVTACYDTLNYLLTEDDLQRCFKATAEALVPNGLFCFDLATDYFLRHYWQGVEVDEFNDWTQVQQSDYDPATSCSTLVLTGFTKHKQGQYRRFREVHVQRAYPETTIAELLTATGFELCAVYDCFTTQLPNAQSIRLMYVARRAHGDA